MRKRKGLVYFILAMFLFSILPLTSVFASSSSTLLTGSETRTKYEDSDPNINFNGTYNKVSDTKFSGGTETTSLTSGDTISFDFEGTGFALFGLAKDDRGIMEVTIDKGFTSKIDLYNGGTIYSKNLYEAYNLTSGSHNVVVKVTGEKNTLSKGVNVGLDYIEIIGGKLSGEIVQPVQFIAGSITSSTVESKDGNYKLTAVAPAKNAAVSYEISENAKIIGSGSLTANKDTDTVINLDVTGRIKGSYNYKLTLKNDKGEVKDSTILTVVVNPTIAPDPEENGPKKIVAYFPNWGIYNSAHQTMQVGQIPWNKVTVINHAFFTIDKSFKLVSTDPEADFDRIMTHSEGWGKLNGHMAEYKYYKTQYPNVKVVISIGGWTRGENFHDMAKTPATRKVFIDSCIKFMKDYPFIDGMDLDWEYPGVDREKDPMDQYDYGCPGGPEDATNFPLLLKEMRQAYKENGMEDKLLTAAVAAGKDKIEKVPPETYEQYLDYLNVMTYDMHGAWEDVTGHHSPLYGSDYEPYDDMIKTYYNINAAMKQYVDAGVSRDKLIVGSPFYSRGWKGVDMTKGITVNGKFYPGLHQKATGAWTGGWDNPQVPGGQEGWFKVKTFETTAGWEKYRDPANNAPYLINKNSGVFLTYEDEVSLDQKLDYILNQKFGGIIVWEASGDDIAKGHPLFTQCYNKLIKDPLEKLPVKVNLQVDKAVNKGSFNLLAQVPANSKATSYKLYEGNSVVHSGNLGTAASGISYAATNKAEGIYEYKLVLYNNNGGMASDILKVTVIDASTPEPGTIAVDKDVNEGEFNLTITAADKLATDYKLYQNNVVIGEGKVVEGKAVINMKNIAYNSYSYKAELINSTTNKSSFTNTVNVKVKVIPKDWAANTTYKAGDKVMWKSTEYECVIGHTALSVWPPDGGGATLWKVVIE